MTRESSENARALFVLWALILFSISGTPATAQSNQGSKPIKIGFITDITGPGAPVAAEMLKGIRLYLEHCGQKMAGRPVELIVENDKSSPATGRNAFKKLVEEDKVDVVDGFLLSTVSYMVAPLAGEFHIPLVIAVSGADDLTQRNHSDWVVRTSFAASQASHPFGEWVYKKLGYRRIATIGMDYSFGWEVIGGFQQSFERAGGKVVQKFWSPIGYANFAPYLLKIRPDADAVFILAVGKDAMVVPQQCKDANVKVPLLGGGTTFDEVILRANGDKTVGAISAATYTPSLNTPENKRFVAAFKAKYGDADPSPYAEGAYVSGMWINKAVESLHGNLEDKTRFLAALKSVELKDAPRGAVKLDKYCNPIENVYVRKVEMVDGKPTNVIIDTFKGVSQFWIWNPSEYVKTPPYSRDYPPCKFCSP